ncbi:MAG: hypothetical protein KAS90_06310 [Candidatus Aenigmarchaeota archaeon]|nr:hypothetical protein [Candidatus Aenigmarchaeota archaeon]
MSLKKSNYRIQYLLVDEMPYHNLLIEVDDWFVEDMRNSNPNKEKYDKIALDAMKISKFPQHSIDRVEENGLCEWDGGLLDNIIFPSGSAIGLVIEYDTESGTRYRSHNVDSLSKMSVLLSIITNYLSDKSMSSVKPNYRIYYNMRDRIPYHSISAEISDDFLEYLKSSDVNEEYYEKLALDAMRCCDVPQEFIDNAKKSGVCDWDGGLLRQILLPYGDATGLIIDTKTPQGNVYLSHNLNSPLQMSVLMTVITNYFYNMDMRINDIGSYNS